MTIIKVINHDWTWLSEYIFAWAEWTIGCEDGRTCQVGMGIKAFGEPRGEKIRFGDKPINFTTIGIGSIHVRVVDGKGRCKVRLETGKVGLIEGKFPFDPAW